MRKGPAHAQESETLSVGSLALMDERERFANACNPRSEGLVLINASGSHGGQKTGFYELRRFSFARLVIGWNWNAGGPWAGC